MSGKPHRPVLQRGNKSRRPEKNGRPAARRAPVRCTLLILAAAGLAFVPGGCDNSVEELSEIDTRGERVLRGSQDHLARAMRLLEHIEDYEHAQASSQILMQLSQWIEDQPPVDDWSVDPMLSSLPQRYEYLRQRQSLARMEFVVHDYYVIREANWMRNVARWQVEQKNRRRNELQRRVDHLADEVRTLESGSGSAGSGEADELLSEKKQQLQAAQQELEPDWPTQLRSSEGERAADDLTTALALFDWTVRNVQLDQTHWDADLPESEEAFHADPPAELVPPPGAELHAWQALLLGHADAATRARIFILLARQQKIDVVMLGIPGRRSDGEPRSWAAAAVIGERLYLFDAELGLPIPGPGGERICTLAQLREHPDILRRLDIDEHKYPVTADDLENLVVLIDATPAYLSQRMMLVERKLQGDQKLVLTAAPSQLARKLRKQSLPDAQIWTVPYRAFVFDRLRSRHPRLSSKLMNQLAVYAGPLPLFAARMHHIRGDLDTDPTKRGAKSFYLACRKPDREIEAIGKSAEARRQIAESMGAQDQPELQQQLIAQIQSIARQAKQQATYWLGLVAFEEEQYGVAVDYLRDRTLKDEPHGRWSNSARYNLARTFEAAGQYEQAISLLQSDDSPQKHGNLLRARRLRERIEK